MNTNATKSYFFLLFHCHTLLDDSLKLDTEEQRPGHVEFPGLSVPASMPMLGAVEREIRQFFRCIINYSGVTRQR